MHIASDFLRARGRSVVYLRLVCGENSRAKNTMLVNNVKSSVDVPSFDQENIRTYIEELKVWKFVTGIEKKKQGPLVWLSLPIEDLSKIKQAINYIIGMEDLSKDDGMDKVIEIMEKTFLGDKEIEAFKKWRQFVRLERNKGENVKVYVNRFNIAYSAVVKEGIMIPASTRALILVQNAGISEDLGRMVIF